MSQEIIILKQGKSERTIHLEDGSYTIGRSPSSDITLSDSAVSKKHAVLEIKGSEFIIRDNQSANGIFFRGKKVIEKKFNNSFEFEIKPYTLKLKSENQPGSINKESRFSDIIAKNFKVSIIIFMMFFVLLSTLVIYSPMKKRVNSIYTQETLKNGILLSRYLAEMNRTFIESGEHSKIRISPVTVEDGVLYAFIVDSHGKIIAPRERQGDFFNWPELAQALRGGQLMIDQVSSGERIIFNPVHSHGQLSGAAIIGFSPGSGDVQGLGGTVFFILIFLTILVLVASQVIVKSFHDPLKRFYEEAELAIKEGKSSINYFAPNPEMENIKVAFNRILLRQPGGLKEKGVEEKPEMSSEQKSGNNDVNSQSVNIYDSLQKNRDENMINSKDIEHPWCIISRDEYCLNQLSDNFSSELQIDHCKPDTHIIEAFDSELIQAVSELIENQMSEPVEIEYLGQKFTVERSDKLSDQNSVLIIFRKLS
ncbi:FHA domain-containing protein [Desulfonatronovibrio magnus]|uniref:FHA domain-containing protein n=1 Tax=Desulfonatronovibrio magnus TaxID=698827 RepID=UPI000696E3D4|nr:FHA domain-containing protein [Desulfonatronovibrio magnus]